MEFWAVVLVIGIITLVGHGIWTFLAWMFRGFRPRAAQAIRCGRCGSALTSLPCRSCGFGAVDPQSATRQVLADLVNRDLLDPEIKRTVEAAMALQHVRAVAKAPQTERPAGFPAADAIPTATHAHLPAASVADLPEAHPLHAGHEMPRPAATPAPVPIRTAQATAPRTSAPPPTRRPFPPAAPPAPPRPPAKPLSHVLASFMEDRNIRWGELVGGMLIVGCSVALVISLWARISESLFLKVGVFTGVVGSLLGLGLYANRKWRLPTTTFAILVIGLLMVPLHLAAMAVIGRDQQFAALAVEAGAVVFLAALVWLAARVVAASFALPLTLGLVAVSLTGPVLFLSGQFSQMTAIPAIALPAAGIVYPMLAILAWQVVLIARQKHWPPARTRQAATALGLTLFAAIPSLLVHGRFAIDAPDYLAVMLPLLLAIPAAICLAARSLSRRVPTSSAWTKALAAIQTVASIAIVGMTLASLSRPADAAITAGLGAIFFAAIAWFYRDTWSMAGLCVLLSIAYLSLFAVFGGTPVTGPASLPSLYITRLTPIQIQPLIVLLAGLGFLFARRGTRLRLAGLIAAGIVAGLSIAHLLANEYLGYSPAAGAAILLGVYALAAVTVGLIFAEKAAIIVGSALAISAIERLMPGHWATATCCIASAWAVGFAIIRYARPSVLDIARYMSWGTLALAACVTCLTVPDLSQVSLSAHAWWLAAIAAVALLAGRSVIELCAFETLLVAAVLIQAFTTRTIAYEVSDTRRWTIAACFLLAIHAARAITGRLFARHLPSLSLVYTPLRIAGAAAGCVVALCVVGWLGICAQADIFNQGTLAELLNGIAAPGFVWTYVGLALIAVLGVIEAWSLRRDAVLATSIVTIYLLADLALASAMPLYGASAMRFASLAVLLVTSAGLAAIYVTRSDRSPLPWLRGPACLTITLLCGAMPLLAFTLMAAGSHFSNTGPRVPAADMLLARLSSFANYIIPLGVLALILIGHALQRRLAALGVCGIVTINIALSLAFLLTRGLDTTADTFALIRANAFAIGLCVWVWLLLRYATEAAKDAGVLRTLAGIAVVPTVVCLLLDNVNALVEPRLPWVSSMTDLCLAFAAPIAILPLANRLWPRLALGQLAVALVALCALLVQTARFAGVAPWDAQHMFLAGHVVSCWAFYFVGRLYAKHASLHAEEQTPTWSAAPAEKLNAEGRVELAYASQASTSGAGVIDAALTAVMSRVLRFAIALSVFTFILALRCAFGPQFPWPTVGGIVALAALAVVISQRELRPSYLYPATICTCIAISLLWAAQVWTATLGGGRDLVMLNIVTLAACGIVSVILERQIFAPSADRVFRRLAPLHLPISYVAMFLMLAVSISAWSRWIYQRESLLLSLGACAAFAGMLLARLWDVPRSIRPGMLWLASMIILMLFLGMSDLQQTNLVQTTLVCACGLTVAWGILFARWSDLQSRVESLSGVLPPVDALPRGNAWAGLAALFAILAQEGLLQASSGRVEMSLAVGVLVGVALLACALGCILTALSKIPDPLHLELPQNEYYVYIAEGFVGLLFLHIRLTHPELFSGFLMQYWPFVVMAIAFGLAGMSEFLHRRGLNVLATPTGHTAFILPLVPAALSGAVPNITPYWALTLSATVFYALLARMAQSTPAKVLAMLAANGTIWAALYLHDSLAISRHPQLWLLPPALSMLLAARFLRDRLTREQATGLRYAGLMLAYLSSAADIFTVGLANAPWLIGVLGLLSVVGVMLGIYLRIQSFLYTGIGFLALSLALLIYHASVNLHQTWLLWLAGVALGVAILAAFAMFERHKQKIASVVEQVRGWEA